MYFRPLLSYNKYYPLLSRIVGDSFILTKEELNLETNNKLTYRRAFIIVITAILFYVTISNPDNIVWLKKVAQPVISAFIMAYLLNPLVNFLKRRKKIKISHNTSVLITAALVIGFIALFVQMIVPTLSSSISTLIQSFNDVPKIDTIFSDLLNFINGLGIISISMDQLNEVLTNVLSQVSSFGSKFAGSLLNNMLDITSSAMNLVVSFFIAIYMLLEREDLIARIKRVIHAYFTTANAEYIINTSRKAHTIFLDFFVGKIIDSTIVGLIIFVILVLFGYELALIIALIIGITNIIPYFGPYIGAVPAVLISLFTDGGNMAIWLGVIIIILQQFDGLYLGPKILGDKVGVSAFWVLVSVTVGGAMMGVWGMLLGVPVVVFAKMLIEENVKLKLDQKNMGSYELAHLASPKKKDPNKPKKQLFERKKNKK